MERFVHTHTWLIQIPIPEPVAYLLRLLRALLTWRAVQPYGNKCQPAQHGNPNTTNPDPRTTDLKTPWVLVVRKVPDGNLPLLVDVGDERPAVIDAEVENAMLIGCPESHAEDGCVRGLCDRRKV